MFDTMLSRDIQQTLERFRRSMDQFFGDVSGSANRGSESSEWAFTPAVETGWSNDSLNFRAILPGVAEEDVKVNLQGNQLVIEGERKEPENFATSGGALRLPYGKFYRAIDLPNGLNLGQIQCRLHDGVLDLRLPIAESMKPRRIAIQTSKEGQKAIAA